jgi:CBS domain-containing protein
MISTATFASANRSQNDIQMKTVSNIMSTSVRTIHRDISVCDLEEIFVTHKISGGPVIDNSGNLIGFVSKSDVTRFDSTGEDPNYTRVFEIASPIVIIISPETTIEEAAQKMLEHQVHHLVVTEAEELVGILSSLDFVKFVASNDNFVLPD